MDLCIIIPLYNYEDKVLSLYNKIIDEFNNVDLNIIFINNGSTDLTIEELKSIHKKDNKRVKIINFLKEYDFDSISQEGILHSKSKYTVLYDVNSDISLKYLSKIYETILKNQEYDYVCVNKVLGRINIIKKFVFKIVDKLFNCKLNTEFSNCIIFKKDILNTLKQNNITIKETLELGFTGYIYVVKTNKSQKIKKVLKNNTLLCIKYVSIINLILSLLLFLIYLLLVFTKINKFNYLSIFLLLILIFISLISILFSLYLKKYNSKQKYIIKEFIGINNDYL